MCEPKKSKMLFGRYDDKIENGAISIPWLKKKIFEKPCYYTVGQYGNKTHIYVHNNALEDELLLIVDSGECAFNKRNQWIVPKSVLNVIGENQCVWLGEGDRAELITEKQIKEAELSQEELENLMTKLSELYDL